MIEGDGTINVPQSLRDDSGRIRYCFINVTFDIRDRSFALYLQSRLGGSVQEHSTPITKPFGYCEGPRFIFDKSWTAYCIWVISAFNELVFITAKSPGRSRVTCAERKAP